MNALTALQIPTGPAGVDALWGPLHRALEGHLSVGLLAPQPLPASVSALHLDEPVDSDIAVVVTTSGSTGNPKGVMCTATSLMANTQGPRYQWILALPASSMGGLNVVLRGLHHGLPPLASDLPIHQSLPDLVASSHALPCAISLVPTQLALCLRDEAATSALRECAYVLVGGARLSPGIAHEARQHGIDVHESYGATETCGGCVIDGLPLPHAQVSLDADQRIRLTGPMVTRGYRCDPTATQAHFQGESFMTNDVGFIDDAGRLYVQGRIDDIVSITGVNVSLNAVADRLAAHPQVQQVHVQVEPHHSHSPAIVAFLVGEPFDIAPWIHSELGKPAIPRFHYWLDEIAMLPNGKVDRQMLSEVHRGHTN
jgi:o-succinylbenzoate---CoA ligase